MIIGSGVIPAAAALADVEAAIGGRKDVVLLAHAAGVADEKLPKDAIVYNFEPLFDDCRSFTLGYLDTLRRHPVWDYQARNVEYLKTKGIEAKHVPYGWHPALTRVKTAPKDIDVLFFGSASPRREYLLSGLKGRCRFVWPEATYGAALDKLVARSHIVLNLHYTDKPHPLEVVRLNYLLANGAFVISERGWDEAENALYDDGLVFSEQPIRDALAWLPFPRPRAMVSFAALPTVQRFPFRMPA